MTNSHSHASGFLFAKRTGDEDENGEDATATRVGNGNMSLPQVGEGGPLAVDEDAPQGDTKRLQQGKKANHTVSPHQSIFGHRRNSSSVAFRATFSPREGYGYLYLSGIDGASSVPQQPA